MSQPPDLLRAVRARQRRLWRRRLLPVVIPFLLVAGFYGLENLRGMRVWSRTRAELMAAGEPMDRAAVVPPAVPDAGNLAMTPWFTRVLGYQTGKDGRACLPRLAPADPAGETKMPQDKSLRFRPSGNTAGGWEQAGTTNLAPWQDYYRKAAPGYFPLPPEPAGIPADDVLAALGRFAPILESLARDAETRPATRFPVDYAAEVPAALPMNHLQIGQRLTQTLGLRASARLAAGQTAGALDDLELALRLREGPAREPTALSHLVVQTELGILFQPLWEGLAGRRWNPAELTRLQAALGRVDPLREYQSALRGERAFFYLPNVDLVERTRSAAVFADFDPDALSIQRPHRAFDALMWLAPRGWFDMNRAVGSQWFQDLIMAADPAQHRAFREKHDAVETAMRERSPFSPLTVLAQRMVLVLANVLPLAAHNTAAVDLAITACALERHFQEHGDYPAALEALVPAYLPRVPTDVMDGDALRYARTANGRYRLWSIGWNEVDEDGRVTFEANGKRVDRKRGDWVWQYTAPPPANPPASPSPSPAAPKASPSP